jgi:hypothetical protein
MLTQITCPRCQTNFPANVNQVVDVGRQPELKQQAMAGALNAAACPNCRAVTQVATPLLYHDPDHELFMVYVPMELGLSHLDQQKVIGQLVKQAMDSLPAEQRRGYMFNPQTIISMQSFMEKILETEGITPDMIARQQAQLELLQRLATASPDVANTLIQDRLPDIDENFFAMLRALIESATQSGREAEALKLINVQAQLMRETEIGQRMERRQMALRNFSAEAKKEGGLTPALLQKHTIANKDDEVVVAALVSMGQPVFDYDFFTLLSERIDKRERAGMPAGELLALRTHLLELQDAIRREAEEAVEKLGGTLQAILEADDKVAAVREHWQEIDDNLLYLLVAQIERAEEQGRHAEAAALQAIQELIMQEMEAQAPPEIRLLNQLMRAGSEAEERRLLDDNKSLLSGEFLKAIDSILAELGSAGQQELADKLRRIRSMIEMRL